jgi:hypothetical protein
MGGAYRRRASRVALKKRRVICGACGLSAGDGSEREPHVGAPGLADAEHRVVGPREHRHDLQAITAARERERRDTELERAGGGWSRQLALALDAGPPASRSLRAPLATPARDIVAGASEA